MQNISEILDFSISALLFMYLLSLIGKSSSYSKTYWFWGVVFILGSKANSVLESLIFSNQFNVFEHTFFLVACILFFLSILKKEL
ncbi:hypothetical protein SLH46_03680 [Draconibacterium sp. IB214405]|uniref:hypothetical protein n=1 Tax=Draconibacterium sp. IB214405 TaxID=3097352 RepID=UPI002A10D9FF|nr:hypothetical protein [Draconibacterium sp. IB214405]MDX8338271.1 hypothetical protein [Draconibacterium sp. IB214405]